MNAKLMRELVDRHAPEPVKQTLAELDKLHNAKRDLQRKQRDLEFELRFGKKPPENVQMMNKCPVCGFSHDKTTSEWAEPVVAISEPVHHERNGHAVVHV